MAGLGAGGDPVGGHQRAVQAQESQAGGVRSVENIVQVRRVGGDGVQALVQIAVGGGDADPGVTGQ